MDCVRSAQRLGARSVHLIYRRTLEDMPAEHEEIMAAEHEGIIFHCLTNPTGLTVENNTVSGLELVKMRQTDSDAKGRRNVTAITDSEFTMKCDLVIAAIGQQVERNVLKPGEGIELDRWNCVTVNPDTLESTRKGVFAGGDCVLGPLTLVHALDQGERAASSIIDLLLTGEVHIKPERRMQHLLSQNKLLVDKCLNKLPLHKTPAITPELDATERIKHFKEVDQVISKEVAYEEANRCLRCYRLYSVVTEKKLTKETTPAGHKELISQE
jgi:formate dehydrogenase beta subunit